MVVIKEAVTTAYIKAAERFELGKALRTRTPRERIGEWNAPSNRRDSVAILEESNLGRVPELVPIRYGRMLVDPFAFLRGSAALMAYDLASTANSGILVQACGDCHLANFGLFATPERNLVFDLNDFDETLPAPWEWDIKRLAASFAVAGRARGLPDASNEAAVFTLARSYRKHLRDYAKMRVLDVWYSRLDDQMLIAAAPDVKVREFRKRISAKARTSITEYLFPKITALKDGHRRIADRPPLVYHLPEQTATEEYVLKLMAEYKNTLSAHLCRLFELYQYQDFAFKVVGVGSVGTRCYVLLFMAESNDSLLLQAKEARASVLEPYAGKSQFNHHGQRVVVGQRLMQSASDMFLGWMTSGNGIHYYIRQLRDMKFSVPLDVLDAAGLARYAELCGWVLARAHARGGDAAMISGYLGKSDAFDQALCRFALAYADQNEQDYQRLVKAVKSGKIPATFEG